MRRVGDAALGLSAALAQYAFIGLFLAIAFKPSIYDTNPGLGARALGLAFAIGVYAFGRWGRRRIKRAAWLDEGLTVLPDCLIVRHNALLTAPVTIPRASVELVRVGDGRGWTRERRVLPMLDPFSQPPNVLLRFNETIDFPARRRRLDPGHPLPDSKELGLLLRVKDPRAAARAFAGWEALRG